MPLIVHYFIAHQGKFVAPLIAFLCDAAPPPAPAAASAASGQLPLSPALRALLHDAKHQVVAEFKRAAAATASAKRRGGGKKKAATEPSAAEADVNEQLLTATMAALRHAVLQLYGASGGGTVTGAAAVAGVEKEEEEIKAEIGKVGEEKDNA